MPSLGVIPFEFWDELISPETRMMGLPYGEEIRIVGRTTLTQTDGQTDRQTDRQNYDHKDHATHSVAR